ncbi:MAG: DUF359 domain-containing protein [Patescibacteria group bacterium]
MPSNFVAVAGTFDHLHAGHQQLLQAAQKTGLKLLVGLCHPSMLTAKAYPESIEPYSVRRQSIIQFHPDKIIPLSDIYGPAATSPFIKTIICSPLTRPNVELINQKRKLNNLNYLSVIETPLVKCADGLPLASTRIRQGLVDRDGYYYPQIFTHDLKLPDSLRPLLQAPFSPIIKTITPPKYLTITVGDIATISLLNQKITPDLAIVDLKTKRQPIFPHLEALGLKPGLTSLNPPGIITAHLVQQLLACLRQPQPSLLVNGEEDLAVLPAVLLSPLKTTIFYGQPDKGLVKILVTESTKLKALNFLKKFI